MKTLFMTSLLTATALMAQTGSGAASASAPAPQTSTPKATTTVKKHHKKHGAANQTATPASTAPDATKAPAKK